MISCDTNILFPAFDSTSPLHDKARTFLAALSPREDVCLCEQVLMELYCLVRNPSVCRNPMSAPDAVTLIMGLRSNPRWHIVDIQPDPPQMTWVWQQAAVQDMAYRRIFDLRLAATLRQHRVDDFVTRNTKDFMALGFVRVWDPLGADASSPPF